MNNRDEVDEIQRAWQAVRPDLDWTPLAVWSRLHRLAALLELERRQAFSAHQLETWEFDVLAALRRAGDPFKLTPGQLVEQTYVTSGTMTNRIDRLESRSLVKRHPNPIDGRGTLVELTAAGKEAVDAAITDLVRVERIMGKSLSEQESAQLADLLARLMAVCQ